MLSDLLHCPSEMCDMRNQYESRNVQITVSSNAYLIDSPDIFIESRKRPLSGVPKIIKGSSPVDGGNFFLTTEEKEKLLKTEPKAEKYIKRFLGAREFLHNEERWCLWLLNATPNDLKSLPDVMKRVKESASEQSGYFALASSIICAVCSIFFFCSSVGLHHGKLLYTISFEYLYRISRRPATVFVHAI